MKRIAIVYDSFKEESQKLALEVARYLHLKCEQSFTYSKEEFLGLDDSIVRSFTEVITLGGDSIVLRVANKVASFGIGLLRVNFGEVGYLTNIEPNEVFNELDHFLQGKYKKVEKARVQGTIKKDVVINEEKKEVSKGRVFLALDALNEIFVGGIRKTVHTRMIIDGRKSFEVVAKGDGAMFVLEAGSTGYNLSAGGPVVHTDLVFAVTLSNRIFNLNASAFNKKIFNEPSFIVEAESRIIVQITRQSKDNLPYLIADSNSEIRLEEGDVVLIEKSPRSTIFLERDREEKKWKIL